MENQATQRSIFKKSKTLGYRSRASFKLIELNKKFKFINKKTNLLDLGSAEGEAQVASKLISDGKILSVDIKPYATNKEYRNFTFVIYI